MRWERLFDDLEAQLDAGDREAFDAEVADRTRRELALVSLQDRWQAVTDGQPEITVEGAGVWATTVRRAGRGWLLATDPLGREVVVPLASILAVRGLPREAAAHDSTGAVASRLDLGHVLRGIARDRVPVAVILRNGVQYDGTIDRVGADFFDLAEHPVGEPRRAMAVRAIQTVAFTGIAVVRS